MEVGDLVVIIAGSIMSQFQIGILFLTLQILLPAWMVPQFFPNRISRKDNTYYQVPKSASDIQKTAISSPFGIFEFLRLSFGLRSAGQMFQRIMDHIFGDVPFCFVYVDDILAFSKNPCFSPMRSF